MWMQTHRREAHSSEPINQIFEKKEKKKKPT